MEERYQQSPYQGSLSRVKRHTGKIGGARIRVHRRGGSWRLEGRVQGKWEKSLGTTIGQKTKDPGTGRYWIGQQSDSPRVSNFFFPVSFSSLIIFLTFSCVRTYPWEKLSRGRRGSSATPAAAVLTQGHGMPGEPYIYKSCVGTMSQF